MATNFKAYLGEIAKYPLLSAEDEIALGHRIQAGDQEARDILINSNLRLVVYIAKSYKSNGMSFEDLVMEGNLGLITAVEKFNPELGYRFSTCATPWIKQAIMKAIIEKGRNIRLPANIYQLLNNMKNAIDDLASRGIVDPTDEQIAAEMEIEPSKIAMLKQWKKDTVSLSIPLGDDTDDTIEDLQPDDSDESPVAYTERNMNHEFIMELLEGLPERTRIIFKMRYGLGEEGDPEDWRNEHTLEEIGAYLGLTRERIRQIEKQTLQELKIKYSQNPIEI